MDWGLAKCTYPLLHGVVRRQGWGAHFRPLQRQADFQPEIRIAWLPNQTPDKLKGCFFFSWHSIEDPGIQNPSTNCQIIFEKSAAGISRAKEQQSRCLYNTDWMMLNKASNHSGANSVTAAQPQLSRNNFLTFSITCSFTISP